MTEKLSPFDVASMLKDEEDTATFVTNALETGDSAYIARALGVVARAKGMTHISNETGLARALLYASFSENGNPTLRNTPAVLKSFGLELVARTTTRGAS
jgi:probable addiction module antidote protein